MSEKAVTEVQSSEADFRTAMSNFAAGVTIVTAADADGIAVGATVSAFSSVSLRPQLVLVCLNADTRSALAISESKKFAIHILEEGQDELALRFAANGATKFEETAHVLGDGGVPLLEECRLQLQCDLESDVDGGDHRIFVGRVSHVSVPADFKPLVHSQRRFVRVIDA